MGGVEVRVKVGWMRCDDMMEPRAREMAHKDMQGSVGQRYRDTRAHESDVEGMLIDAGGFGDVIRDWRLNKGTRDASYWPCLVPVLSCLVVLVSALLASSSARSVRRTLTRDGSE
jgi:hypothetical protein